MQSSKRIGEPVAAAASQRSVVQMASIFGLVAVLVVMAWSAMKPAGNAADVAKQKASESIAQPRLPREMVPPRVFVSETYNDSALKEAMSRLDRDIQELAAERKKMRIEQEDEYYDRIRVEAEAKKDREQLEDELDRAQLERLTLNERLREIEAFAEQTEEEHQALEERLRQMEELAVPAAEN